MRAILPSLFSTCAIALSVFSLFDRSRTAAAFPLLLEPRRPRTMERVNANLSPSPPEPAPPGRRSRPSPFLKSSLVSANTNERTAADPTAKPAKGGSPSDDVVHVGNLDWNVSPRDIADALLRAAAVAGDDRGGVEVTVRAIKQPPRKRDEGKLHGGSATMRFPSKEEAAAGLENLQSAAAANAAAMGRSAGAGAEGGDEQKTGWRVRMAWVVPTPPPSNAEMDAMNATPERAEHRKLRAESYARRRGRVAERTDEVIRSVEAHVLQVGSDGNNDDDDGMPMEDVSRSPVLDAPRLDWSACPEALDPVRGGKLQEGTARGDRKRAAVEAFLHVVRQALLQDDDAKGNDAPRTKVADLGSGAGNLSLPLAWWLQQTQDGGPGVVAVDINGHALHLLEKRAEATASGVRIETMEADLLRLLSPREAANAPASDTADPVGRLPADCSAVVSLHACGSASDLAMAVAIDHSLPFAISPCCIGKLRATHSVVLSGRCMPCLSPADESTDGGAAPQQEIAYPRSDLLSFLTFPDYQLLAAAADYGVDYEDGNDRTCDAQELARRERCKKAKHIVEMDRLQWAKERGYEVRMLELPRIGPLYPKREILLGAKRGSLEASRLLSLATTTTSY